MPLGGRHGRYGPSTGGSSRDVDNLYREVGNIRNQITDMLANADMAQGTNVSASASPGTPFATRSKTKKGGEIDRLVININKNTTSVKVELIAMPDNTGTDPTLAHSKVIEFEYKDITEEEQMAGFIQRESPLLQFLTTYRLTRLVASVLKDDGTTAVAKNPSTSPYKSAPPFAGLADFTTCDSNGQNCTNATTPITSITAGRPMVKWVDSSTDFKLTDSGVKVRMHFAIPKTLDTLRVVLIKASDPKAEAVDYIFQIDKTERDAGTLDRRFAVKLEYGITYNLVRLVGKGDNVGGTASDLDTVRIPADNQGPIPDVGNGSANATFTTPTSAGVGDGATTLKIKQNVTTPYRFKNKGVKGIFDLTFPVSTETITARIREGTDNNIALEDTFSDFTTAEKTAGAATRQFGSLLDFVSPYTVTKLIATGPGIGGEGVSTVKNPLSGPGALLDFTTPDSEGNSSTTGDTLDYISPVGATVTGRVTKRGGIIVKMTITIPRNTRRVTVKIQNTKDKNLTGTDASASVIEYSFEDITDAERSANSIVREFGIPLEANSTYGVVRLIGEGDGLNSSFNGGNNPDVFRVPKTQPTTPFDYKINGTAKTFATLLSAGIGFGTTTVPSKPIAGSDGIVTNTVDQDTEAPFVQLRVYASELKNQVGQATTSGQVTFDDVGATNAFAIVNAVGDSDTAEHIKAGGPLATTNVTFVDIEVPGLTFGKNYAWVRNILTNGTDGRAVAVAATAVSTGSSQLGIPFRAGGSTSIASLSLSVAPPALQDPRHSQVTVTVTNPGNAIFKNLVLTRDKRVASSPPGRGTDISAGYEEVGRLITRGDPTYATTFPYTFVVQHPRSVDISYIARAKGLKLDGADQTDKVSPATTYINTADETAVTDGGAPFYSAVSANARIKWKPNHLRVRFDLPDQNMNTFQRVLLYSKIIGITGSSDLSWNPDTGDFSTTTFLAQDVYLGSLTPGSAVNTYVVDIGRGSHVNLACDKPRPNNKGDEFPQTAFNGLTTSTSVQVMVLIVNQAAITSPYATFTLFTTYTGDQNSIPPFWVSSSNGG